MIYVIDSPDCFRTLSIGRLASRKDDETSMESKMSEVSLGDVSKRGPDAHGQAAMLLVESLIHGLVAQHIITVASAVEIVDTAAEVKAEKADDLGDSPANLLESLKLLEAISFSLVRDDPSDSPASRAP